MCGGAHKNEEKSVQLTRSGYTLERGLNHMMEIKYILCWIILFLKTTEIFLIFFNRNSRYTVKSVNADLLMLIC